MKKVQLNRSYSPDVYFWGFVFLAFCVRVIFVDRVEYWWDEYVTLLRAIMPLSTLLENLTHQAMADSGADCSPPLHHVLVHFASKLGGSEYFVKLPSMLASAFSVGFVYLACRDMFNKQVGVCAALYTTMLIFHIAYGRDIRWYSVFYFFVTATLWLSYVASVTLRFRWFLALSVAIAGMLYTSYVAAAFVVGVSIFCVYQIVRYWIAGAKGSARRLLLYSAVCLGCSLVAYLPQIKGHIYATETFVSSVGLFFDLNRLIDIIRVVGNYFYSPYSLFWLYVALLSVAGLWWAIKRGMSSGLVLLFAWGVPQTIAAFTINPSLGVQPRYLVAVLYMYIVVVGLGAVALGESSCLLWRRIRGAASVERWGTCVSLGIILFMLWPNVISFQKYYQGAIPTNKMIARDVALLADGYEHLSFGGVRQFKGIYSRLLGDLYSYDDSMWTRKYHRTLLLQNTERKTPAEFRKITDFKLPEENISLYAAGILNVSPVSIPSFAGRELWKVNFDSLQYVASVWAMQNVWTNYNAGNMSLYDFGKPGFVIFRLTLPKGRQVTQLRLLAEYLCSPTGLKSGSILSISAGQDVNALQGATLPHKPTSPDLNWDGLLKPGEQASTFDFVFPVSSASDDVYVRVDFAPQNERGDVWLRSLALKAEEPVAPQPYSAGKILQDAIVSRNNVQMWQAGAVPAGSDTLYVFDAGGMQNGSGSANTSDDLVQYKEHYPAAAPVFALPDEQGKPAFVVFDPLLDSGFMPLYAPGHGHFTPVSRGDERLSVASIRTGGHLNNASLSVGEQQILFPFSSKMNSAGYFNLNRDGLIRIHPQFTGAETILSDVSKSSNIKKLQNFDAITCSDGKSGCFVQYDMKTEMKVNTMRLVYYPCGSTWSGAFARLSVSVNGQEYKQVDSFVPIGRESWMDSREGRAFTVDMGGVTGDVSVRVELSGDNMQLFSTPTYPFEIELYVDAPGVSSPLRLNGGEAWKLTQDDSSPLRAGLSAKPISFRTDLARH